MKKIYELLGVLSVIICISTNVSAARVFTVDKSDSGAYQSINEALSVIKALNQVVPKYDSSNHQVVAVKGNNFIEAIGFSDFVNLVIPGDLFSTDGKIWYEVIEVPADGKTLILNRPMDHFSEGAILTSYTIIENNIVNISAGSYYEEIDLSNIHFVRLIGSGKKVTILHKENDKGDYISNENPCSVALNNSSNGTASILIGMPEFGRIKFENMSIFSRTGSALIPTGLPINKTDISLIDIDYDQTFGNDILYFTAIPSGKGNIELINSEFRGTGDSLTFQGVNSVFIDNIKLHARYMPCLNAWVPAGLRYFNVRNPGKIINSEIIIEGAERFNSGIAGIKITDDGYYSKIPKLEIVKTLITSANIGPSFILNGQSQITINDSKVYTLANSPDAELSGDSSLMSVCTAGLDNIHSIDNSTSSNICP